MLATSLALAFALQVPQLELSPDGEPLVQRRTGLSSADVRALQPSLGLATPSTFAADDYGPIAARTSIAPDGDVPSAIAYTTDGARYLIAHRDSRNVLVFDASNDAFVQEIALSGSPLDLAVSPDGLWAATANGFEGTVSLIDLGTLTESAAIGVGPVPASLTFSTDSALIACANAADDTLSVVDVATASVTQTVQLEGLVSSASFAFESGNNGYTGPELLCVDATTAVIPYFFDDQVAFVDLAAGTVNAVDTAEDPRGLAFTAQTGRLVVAHTGNAQTVTVFDAATQTITNTVATGVNLNGPISIRPNGVRGAVAIQNAAFVLNFDTGVQGPQLATASLSELLTTADGQFALGVGFNAPLISYNGQNIVALLNGELSVSTGAVSPVASEAVMTGALFAEDALRFDTSGASGGLLNRQTSGVAPEGDNPRRLAISADGTRAVTTNILSDNASVVNPTTGELLGVVPVGDRPSGVAITPDGSRAVVANLDSTFATVIDLNTLATTDVTISTRGSEVAISPDGQFAYVAVVSGGDGVWRIDLNTLTTSGGKLLTGNMGGVGGSYSQSSGIALSPDGSTLVVCGSFDDVLTLVDTATWTVSATVPAAQFPVRATFVPGTGRFLVTLRNSQELAVFDLIAGGANEVGRVSLGFSPFEFVTDPAGLFAYGGEGFPNNELQVIDLTALTVTSSTPLPGAPITVNYDAADGAVDVLCSTASTTIGGSVGFAITEAGQWVRVDGTTHQIVGQTETGFAGSDLDSNGDRLASTAIRRDLVLSAPQGAPLQADTLIASAANGGTQNLSLDFGPSFAGDLYLILGTANGTAPGLLVDGILLPLTFDNYLLQTIAQANTGIYQNTLGVLDANGQASASLQVPSQTLLDFIGLQVNHVGVALQPTFLTVLAASNPVVLAIEP